MKPLNSKELRETISWYYKQLMSEPDLAKREMIIHLIRFMTNQLHQLERELYEQEVSAHTSRAI